MVTDVIPTSAWAHNCGMHVIADFLVERLQRTDYQSVFTGQPYDNLLAAFRRYYQQPHLSWQMIREASLESTRTDNQIMWGFVLRMLLPDILSTNIEFKAGLTEHFLAAFKLVQAQEFDELFSSYPMMWYSQMHYFRQQADLPLASAQSKVLSGYRLR